MFSAVRSELYCIGETVKAVSDESDSSDPKGVWKIFFLSEFSHQERALEKHPNFTFKPVDLFSFAG